MMVSSLVAERGGRARDQRLLAARGCWRPPRPAARRPSPSGAPARRRRRAAARRPASGSAGRRPARPSASSRPRVAPSCGSTRSKLLSIAPHRRGLRAPRPGALLGHPRRHQRQPHARAPRAARIRFGHSSLSTKIPAAGRQWSRKRRDRARRVDRRVLVDGAGRQPPRQHLGRGARAAGDQHRRSGRSAPNAAISGSSERLSPTLTRVQPHQRAGRPRRRGVAEPLGAAAPDPPCPAWPAPSAPVRPAARRGRPPRDRRSARSAASGCAARPAPRSSPCQQRLGARLGGAEPRLPVGLHRLHRRRVGPARDLQRPVEAPRSRAPNGSGIRVWSQLFSVSAGRAARPNRNTGVAAARASTTGPSGISSRRSARPVRRDDHHAAGLDEPHRLAAKASRLRRSAPGIRGRSSRGWPESPGARPTWAMNSPSGELEIITRRGLRFRTRPADDGQRDAAVPEAGRCRRRARGHGRVGRRRGSRSASAWSRASSSR